MFNSILMHFKHLAVGGCLTIFRTVLAVVLSASLLTACSPGGTTNNYGGTQAGMSGGGATKDPGDGTGGATGDGGGGQGVQCGETKNSKLSNRLFVRDIYEAINNHNRQLKSLENNVSGTTTVSPEALKTLTDSIKQYFGPASNNLEFVTEKFWMEFYEKISFIDDDQQLYPSKDANSPIALPSGCKIVQIAFWDESPGRSESGTLYVNKNLWAKLDQMNKIGLLAHEFFFQQARKANYKNSDFTRHKVGQLLSTAGLPPLFQNWVNSSDARVKDLLPQSKTGFKVCEGWSSDDSTAKIQLYQYEGKDKRQHFVIPILSSTSITAGLFQSAHFTFDPTKEIALSMATDLFSYQSEFHKRKYLNSVDNNSDWITKWYGFSGYLSKDLRTEHSNIPRTVNGILNRLNKTEKTEIWSDNFQAPGHAVKISILNSTSDWEKTSDKTLKSPQDLTAAINQKIVEIVKDCYEDAWQKNLVDENIASLNQEIDSAIKNGSYPYGFPIWKASLKELVEFLASSEEPPTPKCDLLKDDKLTKDIPKLIYKIKINNYTTEDTNDVLGNDSYYFRKEDSIFAERIFRPKIRVTQGNNDPVLFELSCKDYPTVFSEQVKKTQNKKDNYIVPNENLVIKQTYNSENRFNLDYTKGFLSLLNAKRNQFEDVIYQIMGEVKPLNCIKEKYPFNGIACDDFQHLISDIQKEKEVTAHKCENSIYPETRYGEACVVLEMGSTKDTYLIYFRYFLGQDGGKPILNTGITFPRIEFIRHFPYEVGKDAITDND